MPYFSQFRAGVSAALISIMGLAPALADPAPLTSGRQTVDLPAGGAARSYEVFVPENADAAAPPPLLMVLHGTGSTGAQMIDLGKFEGFAAAKGIVLAAPNALGRAFNEGSGRGGAEVNGVDDVAFIEAVADDIRARTAIDTGRMFLAGFSSGGAMAQRMALQSDYAWAAIAAVAAHLWVPAEGANRPTNLLLLWGMEDPLNPKEGGVVPYPQSGVTLDKPAPQATHLKWADLLECYEGDFAEATPFPATTRLFIDTCYDGARLEAYFVDGLGHHWPGGGALPLPVEMVGPYAEPFGLNEVMWEFFDGR